MVQSLLKHHGKACIVGLKECRDEINTFHIAAFHGHEPIFREILDFAVVADPEWDFVTTF